MAEELELEPYQVTGKNFLLEGNRLLADDMGLGKTVQSLAAAEEIVERETYRKIVMVIPKKSAVTQWRREIEKWQKDDRSIQVLDTNSSIEKADYTLTNYGSLYYRDVDGFPKFNILIVDESHFIKNKSAKRSGLVKKLARKADYVWLLTGTPMPNGPKDLWSQLNCLSYPDFSSYWDWCEEYLSVWHNGFGLEVGGLRRGRKKAFGKMLDKWMLRRTRDILDLPDITFQDVYISLTDEQRDIYEDLEDKMIAMIGDDLKVTSNQLAQLTALRQVTNDPILLSDNAKNDGGKMEWFKDHLDDLAINSGKKVIIFSMFSTYVKHLHDHFGGAIVTGDMSSKARDKELDKFKNDNDCHLFFATIGAAGESLNLPEATYVIFCDLPWTPAAIRQAYSRAHRRGQTKNVHVIKLLAENTVDEYMSQIVDQKDKQISKAMATRKLVQRIKEKRR